MSKAYQSHELLMHQQEVMWSIAQKDSHILVALDAQFKRILLEHLVQDCRFGPKVSGAAF